MDVHLRAGIFVALAVVVSGCVSIDVNQEINKDGSSDIGIEVESDSQVARTTVKEAIESSMMVENAVLEEGDNSFAYKFEDVYPQLQEGRFSETVGSRASAAESSNSMFDYEKDSGLVYTRFTLRMNSTGFGNSNSMDGSSSGSEYAELGRQFGESLSSGMEFNYDINTFGTVVDTNGQKMSDGSIRFDLTQDKNYYVEWKALSADLFLSNLGSSRPESPNWDISEWGECSKNETHTRTVELENNADNFMFKPETEKSCEYTVQRNLDEMLLDENEVEGFSKTFETEINISDAEQAYSATFESGTTNITHIVVKPESPSEFLASESRPYEGNYTSSPSYVSGADNSSSTYSLVLDTRTSTEGSGYYTYESETTILQQVLFASKYDVVHGIQVEGESNYGSSVDGVDISSLAETAIQKTE
jgi:hypothetical protein